MLQVSIKKLKLYLFCAEQFVDEKMTVFHKNQQEVDFRPERPDGAFGPVGKAKP
jgi:hypothetical protein